MPCRSDGYPPDTSQRDELNKVTALLCYACSLLFDGENPNDSTKELAAWYEDHTAKDQQRAARQKAEETKQATKARLLKQLTTEEKDALGL